MMDGGFLPNDTPGQATDVSKIVRADDSVVPVTIRQILNATQEQNGMHAVVDGITRRQFSIVGLILKVVEDTLSITYTITDGTGIIEVNYLPTTGDMISYQKNTYIFVCGRVIYKELSNMTAFNVHQVTDHNQIAFHMLQALYVHLQITRPLPANSAFSPQGQASAQIASRQPEPRPAAPPASASPIAQRPAQAKRDLRAEILDFLRTQDKEMGVPLEVLITTIGQKGYSSLEIHEKLDEMNLDGATYDPGNSHVAIC